MNSINVSVAKRTVYIGFAYAVLGLTAGVFNVWFSRGYGFDGSSALSTVHTHLLMLGMTFNLLAGVVISQLGMPRDAVVKTYCAIFNLGVATAAFAQLWRGVHEVRGTDFSQLVEWYEPAIRLTAGVGHALIGVGLIIFFVGAVKAVRQLG